MECQLGFLGDTPFATIHHAMQEAFADYSLNMRYMTPEVLWNRCAKNGVDPACSVGAFAGGRLVGFTLVGVGPWQGEPAAFDAGTGIVPEYRGQGLAGRMFDHALPELRRRGVSRFLLEVLQDNEPAIRAYRKTGFRVTRSFDCFERAAAPADRPDESSAIRPVSVDRLDEFLPEMGWLPSWENSFEAIRRAPESVHLLGVFSGGDCRGLLAYHPVMRWIMIVLVKRAYRRQGIGTRLLAHLLATLPPDERPLRMVNVDPLDEGTRTLLERHGFRRFVSQFEMEFLLRRTHERWAPATTP